MGATRTSSLLYDVYTNDSIHRLCFPTLTLYMYLFIEEMRKKIMCWFFSYCFQKCFNNTNVDCHYLLFIPNENPDIVAYGCQVPQTFYGTPIFVDKDLRCIPLSCDIKKFQANIES